MVDDSPDNQQLIWRFLTKYGAVVDSAENGLQGYRKALSEKFVIVLIALTAHAMSEVRHRCLNVGCTEHLPKPINPRELVETIVRYTSEQI